MRSSGMRSLAWSLALVLGAAAVAAADEGPEGAAARRAEARDAVVKILKAGAVRAVPDKVVVEDARELVAKMTDEQIGVLLERGDLAVALATGAPAKAAP